MRPMDDGRNNLLRRALASDDRHGASAGESRDASRRHLRMYVVTSDAVFVPPMCPGEKLNVPEVD